MKLQYFGDRRDFYKYDFLLELASGLRPPEGIKIIPMLTSPGDPKEGRIKEYPRRGWDIELYNC